MFLLLNIKTMNPTPLRKIYNNYFINSGANYNSFIAAIAKPGNLEKLKTKIGLPGTLKDLEYLVGDELNNVTNTNTYIGKNSPFIIDNDGNQSTSSDYIGFLETRGSKNPYSQVNTSGSNAKGKYQHIWKWNKGAIQANFNNISEEDYYNSPETQDAYQEILNKDYERNLPKLREAARRNNLNFNDEELKAINHHSGITGALKYLNGDKSGSDIPGMEANLLEGRKAGFFKGEFNSSFKNDTTKNQKIQNSIDNIEAITISPDILPTRGSTTFKSKVDKNLVDKLAPIMTSYDLVVTDTNDYPYHKSIEQQNGLSVDINFKDISNTSGEKIRNIINDAAKRGLRLVYEIKDKTRYDTFIKNNPDLKNSVIYLSRISDDHFSVYHDWNFEGSINNPTQNNSESDDEPIRESLYRIKNEITVKAEQLRKALDDANTFEASHSITGHGKLGKKYEGIAGFFQRGIDTFTEPLKAVKSKIFNTNRDAAYQETLKQMIANGELDISSYNTAELKFLFGNKAEIEYLEQQSRFAKDRVESQLSESGNSLGNKWADQNAGGYIDRMIGGLLGKIFPDNSWGDPSRRLHTKDGLINIAPNPTDLFTGETPLPMYDMFLSPDEIMKLTISPLAEKYLNPNDAKDPNNHYNKELRRIQAILSNSDDLQYEADTKIALKMMDVSAARLETLNKQADELFGKDVFDRVSKLHDKQKNGTITPEETVVYNDLVKKLQDSGFAEEFSKYADVYNKNKQIVEGANAMYPLKSKLDFLKKSYQNNANIAHSERNTLERFTAGIDDIIDDSFKLFADIPGATYSMAAGGLGAISGLGGEGLVNRLDSDRRIYPISINPDSATGSVYDPYVLKFTYGDSSYQAVYNDVGEIERIMDSKGYQVSDPMIFSSLMGEADKILKKDYNGKFKNLPGSDFNWGSLFYGIKDTTPQLVGIFATGSIFKTVTGAATAARAEQLASGAASSGLRSSVLNTMAKQISSIRTLESLPVIPVFSRDMINQALEGGAITPGQVFGSAGVYLIVETLAERMFEGPMGKILSGKGISKSMFKSNIKNDLQDIIKHWASGKIATKDIISYVSRVALDFAGDSVKEGLEEAVVDLTQGVVNQFLNNMLDTKYDENFTGLSNVFSSFTIGMGAGAAMSSLRAGTELLDYKRGINSYYNELAESVVKNTMDAVVKDNTVANPDVYKTYLTEMVNQGEISKEDADKFVNAIFKAADDTKFTHDETTPTKRFFGLYKTSPSIDEHKEAFNSFVRGLAYTHNVSLINKPNNVITKAENDAKQKSYEDVLLQLQKNANKEIWSYAIPQQYINKYKLNEEDSKKLIEEHTNILNKVSSTKMKDHLKPVVLGLMLDKEAIKLSKESAKTKEEEDKLNENLKENQKAQEAVDNQNNDLDDLEAVVSNNFTQEQKTKELNKITKQVKDLLDSGVNPTIETYRIILEKTPDALKADVLNFMLDHAEKSVKSKLLEEIKNYNVSVSTATPLDPDNNIEESFDKRYHIDNQEGFETNTYLLEKDWNLIKENYLKQLDDELNRLQSIPNSDDKISELQKERDRIERSAYTDFKSLYNDPNLKDFREYSARTINDLRGTTYVTQNKPTSSATSSNTTNNPSKIIPTEEFGNYTEETILATDVKQGDILKTDKGGIEVKEVNTNNNGIASEISLEDSTTINNPHTGAKRRTWEVTILTLKEETPSTPVIEVTPTEAQEKSLELINKIIEESKEFALEDASDISVDEKGNIVEDASDTSSETMTEEEYQAKKKEVEDEWDEALKNSKLNDSLAAMKLAEIAKRENIDLSSLTREEYVDYAINKGFKISDTQIRNAPELRNPTNIEDTMTLRKNMREQISKITENLWNKWTNSMKLLAPKSQKERYILDNVMLSSGTTKSDSWLFFIINNSQLDNSQAPYKSYFSLKDFNHISPEKVVNFMKYLQENGYSGGIKTFQNLVDQGVLLNDQFVMHGDTKQHAELGEKLAKEFFKNEIKSTGLGKDSFESGKPKSYSEILSDNIEKSLTASNINKRYAAQLAELEKQRNQSTSKQSDPKNTFEIPSHYSRIIDGTKKIFRRVSNVISKFVLPKDSSGITNILNSLPVGNFVDTFARLYFERVDLDIFDSNGEILNEDSNKKYIEFYNQFRNEIKSNPNHQTMTDLIDLNSNTPPIAFKQLMFRLYQIKNEIKAKHENAIFITKNMVLNANLNHIQTLTNKNDESKTYDHKWNGVAGAVDMLVIDADGKIHIYDFKSTKENTNNLQAKQNSVKNSDLFSKYINQQSMYAKMLTEMLKLKNPSEISLQLIYLPVLYDVDPLNNIKDGSNVSEEEIKKYNPSPKNLRFTNRTGGHITRAFIIDLNFNKDVDGIWKSLIPTKEDIDVLTDAAVSNPSESSKPQTKSRKQSKGKSKESKKESISIPSSIPVEEIVLKPVSISEQVQNELNDSTVTKNLSITDTNKDLIENKLSEFIESLLSQDSSNDLLEDLINNMLNDPTQDDIKNINCKIFKALVFTGLISTQSIFDESDNEEDIQYFIEEDYQKEPVTNDIQWEMYEI